MQITPERSELHMKRVSIHNVRDAAALARSAQAQISCAAGEWGDTKSIYNACDALEKQAEALEVAAEQLARDIAGECWKLKKKA